MAAAETGSGKTGAFALPVLQIVHEALRTRQRARDSAATASAAGAAPAPAGPPPCVLNAEDRDAVVAVAPDGLRCQARSEQAWGGVRGTLGAFGGRVYYEATVADEGLCRWVAAGVTPQVAAAGRKAWLGCEQYARTHGVGEHASASPCPLPSHPVRACLAGWAGPRRRPRLTWAPTSSRLALAVPAKSPTTDRSTTTERCAARCVCCVLCMLCVVHWRVQGGCPLAAARRTASRHSRRPERCPGGRTHLWDAPPPL